MTKILIYFGLYIIQLSYNGNHTTYRKTSICIYMCVPNKAHKITETRNITTLNCAQEKMVNFPVHMRI